MFVEIELSGGTFRLVNVDKILFSYENRGKMCIELEDGTPLSTKYTRSELKALFQRSGVLCIDLGEQN